jgi:DNA-damage-inducible protein D
MSDDRGLLPFEEGAEGAGWLVRRQWHEDRWFFSVVDVVGLLSEAASARTYWAQLKAKLGAEGAGETLQALKQLKMRSLDGKMRATDAADVETMLRIMQSVPSPKAEPVRQWLAREGARRLEETQRRQILRGEVAEKNRALAGTVQGAGVVTGRDFAVFQDFGYRGLYNGETARDIAARKGLARGEHILDWMGSEELADNWFRITQAEAKIAREGIDNKADANRAHHEVGAAVRHFIVDELGGTPPEELPTPAESAKRLERLEQQRLEAERQPSLFAEGEGENGGNDAS